MKEKISFDRNDYIVKLRRVNMNQNDIAKEISIMEGGAENLSIAQIKEVMKCYNHLLAREESWEILKMLKRY